MSNGQRPLQFCKEYLGLSVVLLVTNWTGLASFNSPGGVTSCDVVFNQRKRRERERETERTAEKNVCIWISANGRSCNYHVMFRNFIQSRFCGRPVSRFQVIFDRLGQILLLRWWKLIRWVALWLRQKFVSWNGPVDVLWIEKRNAQIAIVQ